MNILKNACYGYLNTPKCNLVPYIGQFSIGHVTLPMQAIIHESGHAIAARILYKNADTKTMIATQTAR